VSAEPNAANRRAELQFALVPLGREAASAILAEYHALIALEAAARESHGDWLPGEIVAACETCSALAALDEVRRG
jgi:hypothetical protein